MRFLLLLTGICLSMLTFGQAKPASSPGIPPKEKQERSQSKEFSFKIIPAEEKTWGYDIYRDEKLYIHQPSIPAVKGNKGFRTKSDAEKVAKLVIEKINKRIIPPTVTIEEMKKLKVL